MNDNEFRRPGSDAAKPQPTPSSVTPQAKPTPSRVDSGYSPAKPSSAKNSPAKPSSANSRSVNSGANKNKPVNSGAKLKSTPDSNQQSLDQKRKAYDAERREKIKRRELKRVKFNLRKRVSGKPDLPSNSLTPAGILGKFAGKLVLLLVIILAVAILFAGGTGIGIVVGYISTATELSTDLFNIEENLTSYVYDSNGTEIAALTGTSNINRELVDYSEVANTYIDEAFISIEDRTFETNIGIDPRRIISAVIGVFGSGDAHGGSTITQQTVKMLTGEDQVSIQRKVQEWYRAVKLTDTLKKPQIMDLYLNMVPMGNNYVGIQSAAKAYFGKNASELNLAECALLAGIPKSPSSYNPRTELGRKNAQRRQRVVLQAMVDEGHISAAQFEEAMNYELVYNQQTIQQPTTSINSYFEEYAVQEVINDLVSQKGYSEAIAYRMVMNGGLQIHTTQDSAMQANLDAYFSNIDYFQTEPGDYVNSPEAPQAGVAVIDNQNNTVVAIQGGYGPKTANLVMDRATDMRRQPASSIKPLAVYGPALDMNLITPATIIVDEPVYMDPHFPDTPWPKNSYDSYYGNMNVEDIVKISNNVPAVKVLDKVGVASSKNILKQMGIDLSNDPVQLSLATGGLTYGTSPLRMADAFKTFPNGGLYTPAKPYTQVLDKNGTVILDNTPDFIQVFQPESAYMMQTIMEEVLNGSTGGTRYRGTAAGVGHLTNAAGEAIASSAKTGTSNNRNDEWMIMQSPYYTSVGWYGFDNRLKQTYIEWKDFYHIHDLVGDFMKDSHQDLPAADWVRPAGIVALDICTISGQLATPGCAGHVRTMYFKAGNPLTPSLPCGVHSRSGAPINYMIGDQR